MGSSLRGDGLFRAHDALVALLEDPQLLDRARSRFDHSPPPYRSQPSGTTTRSPSPDLRTDEERHRDKEYEERYAELTRGWIETLAHSQFCAQMHEEEKRISEKRFIHKDVRYPIDTNQIAKENVKKLWIEQGIWDDKWDVNCPWSMRWKHKMPLGEGGQNEASRPFHQFVFQVSKRREQIEAQSLVDQAAPENLHDINTRAYDDVKNIWIKRKIWNMKWGILPGMTWFSDQPLDEYREQELGPKNKPEPPSRTGNSFEVREAPPRRYRSIFEVSAESIQQTSTAQDLFRLGPEDTSEPPSRASSSCGVLGAPSTRYRDAFEVSPTQYQGIFEVPSTQYNSSNNTTNDNNTNNNNANRASLTPSPHQPPGMIRGSGSGRGRPRCRGKPAQESEQPSVPPRRSKRLHKAEAPQQAPVRASKQRRIKPS
ncbi:hypothetical protein GGR51DRAFT_140401 [Nemania sp. FL0031]|nr:hypothetical protein GGR51DRAFT_140401 [Nemania sp. FL0031]